MQAQKYLIKDWPEDERPREKLLTKGPRFLSNTELLALLLRHGTSKKPVIDLAREILQLGNNDLIELGKLSVKELTKPEGMGMAKATIIAAALELGRRRQAALPTAKQSLKQSSDIALFFQGLLRDHNYEVFAVVFLNRSNRIIHYEIVSEGGITATVADPRIILKKAILHDAVNIVLCHNHPSGSLTPSRADQDLTLKIKEAARFLDITVMDHVIVSENGYFSFADAGIL
jgi:DNA repair protein RadC